MSSRRIFYSKYVDTFLTVYPLQSLVYLSNKMIETTTKGFLSMYHLFSTEFSHEFVWCTYGKWIVSHSRFLVYYIYKYSSTMVQRTTVSQSQMTKNRQFVELKLNVFEFWTIGEWGWDWMPNEYEFLG